ncbi:hypothetical protein FRC03_007458, partial [Tulasnella sp. 419]
MTTSFLESTVRLLYQLPVTATLDDAAEPDRIIEDTSNLAAISRDTADTLEIVQHINARSIAIEQRISSRDPRQLEASHSLPTSVMPPEPTIFGREAFIEQAIELIVNNPSARIAILGPGGIGKTSTALKIIRDERIRARFDKNRIWIPCDQATSVPLLFDLIANGLDLPSSKSNDRFKEIIVALKSLTQRVVLLLDNLETPWDIEGQQSNVAQILARLAAVASVSMIITMRGSQYPAPDSVQWSQPLLSPLTPLEIDAGRDAFLRIAADAAADPDLNPLLKELDCVPLAITLMAKLALVGETPTELLIQWKEGKTALLDQGG